jgi:hypothetical protein
VKKSELLRALQQEILRRDFSYFVDQPPSVAQGGKGVVVPGCAVCQKRINTMNQFLRHLNGRANQLATQRLEAQKPLLEERLRLYVEATTATATIATSQNTSEAANAKERFWRLYRGPTHLVQDYRVSQSISEFSACLQDSKCQSSLAGLSENLARNCANSLHTDFILASPGVLKVVVQ